MRVHRIRNVPARLLPPCPWRAALVRRPSFLSGVVTTSSRKRWISTQPIATAEANAPPSFHWKQRLVEGQDAWGEGVLDFDSDVFENLPEEFELNSDFWGNYKDIPSMARARDKADISRLVDNFALIQRRHHYLFQSLKVTVMETMEDWSAPELAELCNNWARLKFLHEDLCVAMVDRVVATASDCSAQQLCWLMDAYATVRCSVQSVNDEMVRQTLVRVEDLSIQQLCLHVASFARLDVKHDYILERVAERLVAALRGGPEAAQDMEMSALDLTLAAYAFGRFGFQSETLWDSMAKQCEREVREFTAKDLQTILVAMAQVGYRNDKLLSAFSGQIQRRIAQFNGESFALTLRAMAFLGAHDSALFTRVVMQMPRVIDTLRPADLTMILNACTSVGVCSPALFDLVTPCILEKASAFTAIDWLSALRAYAFYDRRDAIFLEAFRNHMSPSKLSLAEMCQALTYCSMLSCDGPVEALAHAAVRRLSKCERELVELPLAVARETLSVLSNWDERLLSESVSCLKKKLDAKLASA
eukprot:TRINITY_DN36128_c0_g1_i1.p1 TRINITY_DN36128_c0_g1~~TRINITY_DN36128_c0_g1_i1.p1  ORF type:complete len:532 (-),score=95.55 TRINITY_DN36128_c0_g1_i1:58-1653(-)